MYSLNLDLVHLHAPYAVVLSASLIESPNKRKTKHPRHFLYEQNPCSPAVVGLVDSRESAVDWGGLDNLVKDSLDPLHGFRHCGNVRASTPPYVLLASGKLTREHVQQ